MRISLALLTYIVECHEILKLALRARTQVRESAFKKMLQDQQNEVHRAHLDLQKRLAEAKSEDNEQDVDRIRKELEEARSNQKKAMKRLAKYVNES